MRAVRAMVVIGVQECTADHGDDGHGTDNEDVVDDVGDVDDVDDGEDGGVAEDRDTEDHGMGWWGNNRSGGRMRRKGMWRRGKCWHNEL